MADSKISLTRLSFRTKGNSKSKTRNKPNSEVQIKIIKELKKIILPSYKLTHSEKKKIINTLIQKQAFNIPSRISDKDRDNLLKILITKRSEYHTKRSKYHHKKTNTLKKFKKQKSSFDSLFGKFTDLTSTIRNTIRI